MPSTGAFSATFFSSSKVFDFFAINDVSLLISCISIYGSLIEISKSCEIRSVITEL